MMIFDVEAVFTVLALFVTTLWAATIVAELLFSLKPREDEDQYETDDYETGDETEELTDYSSGNENSD